MSATPASTTPSSTTPISQLLRPLGAFEQTIDLYTRRNPVQFTLVLELVDNVFEADLASALAELQDAHPLLNADIRRHAAAGEADGMAVFQRSGHPIPIRIAHRSTWQREAAVEQTDPIPSTPGPLIRSVLIPGSPTKAGSTVLLTFSHQIADGRGAITAAADLAACLGGADLPVRPLPPAQEDLFDKGDVDATGTTPESAPSDTEAPRPGHLRPFDTEPPILQPAELDRETTACLVRTARDESSTVQAALCAAAAIALGSRTGRQAFRINVPVDLRSVLHDPYDVAIRFTGALVSLTLAQDASFWDLARRAGEQLAEARRPEMLRAAALGLAAMAPTTADAAEQAMLAATAADIEITNLGVADIGTTSMSALWGPTMTTQVDGEQILGVVTQGGVLRMVTTTRSPLDGLTDHIGRILASSCREMHYRARCLTPSVRHPAHRPTSLVAIAVLRPASAFEVHGATALTRITA